MDDAANNQQKFNAALEDFQVAAGSGFIKQFTDKIYELGTAFLRLLQNVNRTNAEFNQDINNDIYDSQIKRYKELGDESNAYAKIDKENAEKRIKTINDEISANEKVLAQYEDYNALQKFIRQEPREAEKRIKRF